MDNNKDHHRLAALKDQDHDQDDHDHQDQEEISGPTMMIPIANVGRLMKQALPGNARVSKEAKERMQECATEFISFVTGEASQRCRRERRKTVNGDDLCWALRALGFDDYVGPTSLYLHRYRQCTEGTRDLQKPTAEAAPAQPRNSKP